MGTILARNNEPCQPHETWRLNMLDLAVSVFVLIPKNNSFSMIELFVGVDVIHESRSMKFATDKEIIANKACP